MNTTLFTLLLPLAVFIGFLGVAVGGPFARPAVIVAAVLAGVNVLYLLLH